MAGNIYGYQGVHTPLESVTQGRYTLADYTTMRTELTSRLIALENQGGFIPTNVEITGYLHMLPGGAGLGEIETTSSITGASLYINGEMHGGNVVCDNNLACGGILSGNGSGLTNITGTDSTKLPLAGGTLTGPLISQAITVNAGYTISGNGSGLTNINDITKLPLSGGTLTNSLTITAPGKYIGDGSLLTGVVGTDATKLPLAGGTMTGSLTLTAPAKFIGDGSLLTGVVDATKLPLSGGTLTNSLTITAPGMYIGDGSLLTGIVASDPTKLPLSGGTMTGVLTMLNGLAWETFISRDQGLGETYTPPANSSTLTTVVLQFQNNCSLNLANFAVNLAVFPDSTRYITVVKAANFAGPFDVAISPPAGYTFYSPAGTGSASYAMGPTEFSLTMSLVNYGPNTRIYITALQ